MPLHSASHETNLRMAAPTATANKSGRDLLDNGRALAGICMSNPRLAGGPSADEEFTLGHGNQAPSEEASGNTHPQCRRHQCAGHVTGSQHPSPGDAALTPKRGPGTATSFSTTYPVSLSQGMLLGSASFDANSQLHLALFTEVTKEARGWLPGN
ncbi:hypothetical protein ALP29_200599 [Pseudomonas syringae pv. avii]|uniref:Uncharacterized protein n=1 Tax=Pseudomonas syringae pv. avii TaxID=663959 RepID=A0A3M5VLG2_PSESX|nr:hypothetical protein ALP29_200599 [Pseudomonas syringae pv. avii]